MTSNHHTPPSDGAEAKMSVIRAPLSQLDTKITSMDADLTAVVTESGGNATDITALQASVADHETRITDVEADMPVPSGNVGEFYNGLGGFSVPAGSGSTNGHVIQSEGVSQTQRVNLNFTGAGVTVSDGPSATEIAIGGGSIADGDYGDVVVSGGGAVMTVESIDGVTVSTDGTFASNSDLEIPTVKAAKTYSDALIAASDAMVFKNVIDCSANPNYPSADRGHTYRVSVAGKIGGASGVNVEVGDLMLCLTDSTASGDQATVGASWAIAQTNIDGAVVGPASATSGNIATFNGTSGKAIQDSSKALPSGNIVGTTDTQTLSGKELTNPSETSQALTDGASIDWNANSGGYATVTLGGNRTFNAPTNLKTGGHYTLKITQDGTGGRNPTWNAVFKNTPQIDLVASSVTILEFISDGTNLYYCGGLPSMDPPTETIASSSTPTVTAAINGLIYTVTALAAGATFGVPGGSPKQGYRLLIRIKDNGTARSLAFNAIFRAIGVTLPTTTVISKTLYILAVYNSTDTKWDVLAIGQEA